MNNIISKFIYEKCEFEIGESFCEFCIHYIKGISDRCNKYEKIPDDIRLMERQGKNWERKHEKHECIQITKMD